MRRERSCRRRLHAKALFRSRTVAPTDFAVLAHRAAKETKNFTVFSREAVEIAERKKQLVSILADVATLGSERMVETIGKAGLRDAAIGTGIAVDKMLALTGQMPAVQIANIVMPSAEERAKIDASHRALDAIARRLAAAQAPRE
jgi:hypothetical protein